MVGSGNSFQGPRHRRRWWGARQLAAARGRPARGSGGIGGGRLASTPTPSSAGRDAPDRAGRGGGGPAHPWIRCAGWRGCPRRMARPEIGEAGAGRSVGGRGALMCLATASRPCSFAQRRDLRRAAPVEIVAGDVQHLGLAGGRRTVALCAGSRGAARILSPSPRLARPRHRGSRPMYTGRPPRWSSDVAGVCEGVCSRISGHGGPGGGGEVRGADEAGAQVGVGEIGEAREFSQPGGVDLEFLLAGQIRPARVFLCLFCRILPLCARTRVADGRGARTE